jgi:dienelactone hydrolase
MRFTSEATSNGVSERVFSVGEISGVLWTSTDRAAPRPLVLLAHGGGQHKKSPGILDRARYYITDCGFSVAAIDAPGHGDRPRTEDDERFSANLKEQLAHGGDIGPLIAANNQRLAAQAVPEWRSVLEGFLELDQAAPTASIGFWGVSLGSAVGIPLVASEPRIVAAVLGLVGYQGQAEQAAKIAAPVQFLLQWDDEHVPRDAALALYDAFGSREKTLHANAGRHARVPTFEIENSGRFFRRHLIPVICGEDNARTQLTLRQERGDN